MPLEQEKNKPSHLGSSPERNKSDSESLKEDFGLTEDLSEALGMAEEIEGMDAMGHVSERAKEKVSEKGGGIKTGKSGTAGKSELDNISKIRRDLLKRMPSGKREMVKQVEKQIQKEIDELHKQAMRMIKTPGSKTNYFELNDIVKKIRVLKGILNSLFKASMKKVRTLWLRYVAGIM